MSQVDFDALFLRSVTETIKGLANVLVTTSAGTSIRWSSCGPCSSWPRPSHLLLLPTSRDTGSPPTSHQVSHQACVGKAKGSTELWRESRCVRECVCVILAKFSRPEFNAQFRLLGISQVENYPLLRQTFQLPSSGLICIDLSFCEPYVRHAYPTYGRQKRPTNTYSPYRWQLKCLPKSWYIFQHSTLALMMVIYYCFLCFGLHPYLVLRSIKILKLYTKLLHVRFQVLTETSMKFKFSGM
jgi:hypothetical protein